MSFAGLLGVVLLVACPPPGTVRVAEVFYDAAGDDRGLEFVELINVGPLPVPLAGARLEAGDGSAAGRWSTRWTGTAADTIPTLGRFVIGGAGVPGADAHATLDLQNGPDAVRFVAADGATDLVGYGAHELDEYYCGAPAADVASGFSLARVPDAGDTGSNARDFRAATPSPGRPNQARRNLACSRGSLAVLPEQPEIGQPFVVTGRVHNPGAETVAPSDASWTVLVDGVILGAAPLSTALEPSDTVRVEMQVKGLLAGRWTVSASAGAAGDEVPEDDSDSLVIRVGPGALEITEIQFHPASGEGEWVEIRNGGGTLVAVGGFRLSDRGSSRGEPLGAARLSPGDYGVLVQDPAAFRSRYPDADTARIWETRPWPSLNNSDDATGVADAVVLREADGTPCARLDYSARGVPAGVPIERDASGWQPASDPLGTPLAPPRVRPEVPGRFQLAHPRVMAGAIRERCSWSLPWPRARIGLDVYDLAGRHVLRVSSEREVGGRGDLEWDARGLDAGLYLVVLRARREGGEERVSVTRPLRIEGAP